MDRLRNIFEKFVDLGFDKKLLNSQLFGVAKKHNFRSKWGAINKLSLTL